MRILLKNAKILKISDENIIEGHVVVNDNLIEKVGSDINLNDKYDQVIDCQGNLLMPGFKNAHTHSAMTFLRSVADDSSLQDWLFKEIFPREDNLHEGCIRELSKVAILEYLTSGITSCFDMYFYPEEFRETCEEMGFRALNIDMFNKDNNPRESMLKSSLLRRVSLTRISLGSENTRLWSRDSRRESALSWKGCRRLVKATRSIR